MSNENIKEFANKLALHCQSALRGIKTRDKIQIKKWERANIAAYRIQEAFRRWKLLQFTSRRKNRVLMSQKEGPKDSWRHVLDGSANFEDKMATWRNVIELRRCHRDLSTDVCLKALIETHGELSRAIPLLGSKDFTIQADYRAELGVDFKNLLNPYIDNTATKGDTHKAEKFKKLRAHRHLQESLMSSSTATLPSALNLERVVMKSYYVKSGFSNALAAAAKKSVAHGSVGKLKSGELSRRFSSTR